MTFPSISTRTFAVAAFLFSFLTLVSTNIYFASSNSNEITGCVNKKTGILRISSKCTSSERLISWNKIGPQGENGAIGAQGIKGDIGPKGETGATGLQGIKGDTGPQGAQANLRAVTLNYVVRLPVTFTVENNDIVNIQLAPGANCSPGTVGSRILGSSLEMVSGTTGFQMFNCTATVYVP